MKNFCIIPALNEEERIVNVINQVKKYIDNIVIVDDGSSDRTYEVSRKEGVVVLRHAINRGQGASLQTGNKYALEHGADIIVHFDADNQFKASEIEDIIKPIKENNYDVVFGSRFLEKKSNIPKFKKNIILPLARVINKVFFNIKLTDPQSGFRAMNSKVARKIVIENDRMAHCSEILHKVFKNKFRVKEVPITVSYHEFGQKLSGGIKIIKDLIMSKIIN